MNKTTPASVFIHRGNKASGPFTRIQIRNGLATGKLKLTDSFSFGQEEEHKKLKDFYLSANITYSLKKSWGLKRHSVRFSCPHCDATLRGKLKEAGNTESCPDCGTIFIVPGENDKTQLLGETGKSTSVENVEIEKNQQSKTHRNTEPEIESFQALLGHQNINIDDLTSDELARQRKDWNNHIKKNSQGNPETESSSTTFGFATAAEIILAVIVIAVLFFVIRFAFDSVAYLRDWLPEGTSLSKASFLAGLFILLAPLGVVLAASPLLVLIVIVVDEKLLGGGIMNSFINVYMWFFVIGCILMLLAVPIWLIELFL